MNNCFPLPGKRIDLERTSFFIHGIVHENPFISISNEFKKDLAKTFEGYSTICEDGISQWIPNSKSFNEAEYFNFNKLTFSSYFNLFKNCFYNLFITRTHKTSLIKKVKLLRKVKDLEPFRKELFSSYYPEPSGMNLILSKNNNGTIDSLNGEIPLRIKRYIYEAKEAINYAKENNLKELHIVVGYAHELPLEYLISKNRNI